MLSSVSPFAREVGIGIPRMQLLMLLKKAGDGESLPTGVARPGLLARVSPFVDVQMGSQLVGLPAHVTAERALVGV